METIGIKATYYVLANQLRLSAPLDGTFMNIIALNNVSIETNSAAFRSLAV
jgi:hypothetical protein